MISTRTGAAALILALVPALVLLSSLAFALPAGAIRFTSTFDSIRVEAHPGQVVTRTFRLSIADEGVAVRFRSHVQDWWTSEDGSSSYYRLAGELPNSCGHWVALDPMETTVPAGGDLAVRVSLAVPPETAPGGYWCVLTVDEVPDPRVAATGVGVRFRASVSVGIFVYVPPIRRDVAIRAIEVGRNSLEVRLENTGNSPVAVEGRLELRRDDDDEPVILPLARTTLLREPAAARRIRVPLPPSADLPPGSYHARLLLDVGLDHYIGVERTIRLER